MHTARSVIDIAGQRVNATDKLYLAEAVPTLIVWGERDSIIPARHGIRAHDLMPGSRLALFEGAGHFPHHDDPTGFAAAITGFVDTTLPSEPDEDRAAAPLSSSTASARRSRPQRLSRTAVLRARPTRA